MIFGIGIDQLDIARMDRLVRGDDGFVARVFTAEETRYCHSQHTPAQHFAARFCAKEAFFKALGTGWRHGMGWTEVEVVRDELGRPEINLAGKAAQVFRQLGLTRIHLSLTHTGSTATAMVVVEK
ncbi:MAG TPA: holo-ACP synthase [Candidatus Aminicenantes bacterium]|nr:holo-ACP synthase [Candidatus Aminicenantes bacterium]